MKLSKNVILNAVVICTLLSILLSPMSSKGQSCDNPQWGVPVDGLQMSISIADSGKANVPEFMVALRNVGEKDSILNLGIMLGNGVQEPDIWISITDANGKPHKFQFASIMMIEGRVYDYIVRLRAGSTYTLKLSSEHFYLLDTLGNSESISKLLSGKYMITAHYDGRVTESGNPDTRLMGFWPGKLQSNVLRVEK